VRDHGIWVAAAAEQPPTEDRLAFRTLPSAEPHTHSTLHCTLRTAQTAIICMACIFYLEGRGVRVQRVKPRVQRVKPRGRRTEKAEKDFCVYYAH